MDGSAFLLRSPRERPRGGGGERTGEAGHPARRHRDVPIPDFKSPRSAQVWFLHRSRQTWKTRCKQQKVELKRMRNNVADARRSRDKSHAEAEELRQRVQILEAQNAGLQEQMGRGEKRRGAEL